MTEIDFRPAVLKDYERLRARLTPLEQTDAHAALSAVGEVLLHNSGDPGLVLLDESLRFERVIADAELPPAVSIRPPEYAGAPRTFWLGHDLPDGELRLSAAIAFAIRAVPAGDILAGVASDAARLRHTLGSSPHMHISAADPLPVWAIAEFSAALEEGLVDLDCHACGKESYAVFRNRLGLVIRVVSPRALLDSLEHRIKALRIAGSR